MSSVIPRVVPVRGGDVQPTGSWLYVWMDVDTGEIAYVGGTGYDPELRAYLHVRSEDRRLGRVRATVPRYDERDFDVDPPSRSTGELTRPADAVLRPR
ncbi:hypothetical protein [Microbacterium oleivorans]|uniref:Uncharacterized protein n=1 Tax=Microbacterium oleivorans TaxID=273677 RepID=A0A7D5IW06_9MICO|nr:hypothetical protein [Microbacterium oleivorans]QLD10796.1 hypothetical protein HW566_02755 [Microbacterium oleivorans]